MRSRPVSRREWLLAALAPVATVLLLLAEQGFALSLVLPMCGVVVVVMALCTAIVCTVHAGEGRRAPATAPLAAACHGLVVGLAALALVLTGAHRDPAGSLVALLFVALWACPVVGVTVWMARRLATSGRGPPVWPF